MTFTYELEHLRNKILFIDTTVDNSGLYLHIKLKVISTNCSHCMFKRYLINDYVKTKITHSITLTRKVYIIYYRRRYKCKSCNKTFYENDPFTDHKFRLSKLTIMNILEYLKDVNHSFTSAAKLFNVSVNTVINVFDQYIKPKRRKLPKVLCIDEVHIKSNIKYPYACVLLDFDNSKIVDVLKIRRKEFLNRYFDSLTTKELDNVEYVVMDLWSPYKDVIKRFMPKAKIVADAFHVITNINRILDKKRTHVMNYYLGLKNDNLNYSNDFGYLLKKYS